MASASDDTGIASVQFQLDGINVGAEDITAPYTLPFNTINSANGTHVLIAVARDLVNDVVASAQVAFTIDNTGPTDPSTIGQWSGPVAWPFVAIHMTLFPSGDVVAWDDHTENARVVQVASQHRCDYQLRAESDQPVVQRPDCLGRWTLAHRRGDWFGLQYRYEVICCLQPSH